MIDVSELSELADDLRKHAGVVVRHARGVTAAHVNQVRDTATALALSKWTKYGRGLAGSAGRITARLAKDNEQAVGYVFLEGVGGIMQERGTSRHPPNPVLAPAAEQHEEEWQRGLRDIPDLGDDR